MIAKTGSAMRILVTVILTCTLYACIASDSPEQAFAAGDYGAAFRLWQERAEDGDTDAWYRIGILYYLGLGVKRNNHKAHQWILRAARSGHPSAQRDLGLMYESGRTGKRDMENAYMWLYAAYQQGNRNAEPALQMLSGQLSPNRVRQLKQTVRPYIRNDIVDPEDDDY